jgi:hypothetical protein
MQAAGSGRAVDTVDHFLHTENLLIHTVFRERE